MPVFPGLRDGHGPEEADESVDDGVDVSDYDGCDFDGDGDCADDD